MTDIIWPEGATHIVERNKVQEFSYYKDGLYWGNKDEEFSFIMGESNWKVATIRDGEDSINLRPQSKPVYTQVMYRANEVPVIGSEIVMRYMHDSCTVTHQGIVKYASLDNVILDIEGNERHLTVGDYAWEPIDTRTDEEKAIDEASKIVDSDGTCNKLNINIDCSAAMKAVICALVKNGWSKS